jgi:hypothetical protein
LNKNLLNIQDFTLLQKNLVLKESMQLRVASDSMHPLLKIDQIITVRPYPVNKLAVYDLIVYLEQGQLQVHFLWHINGNGALVTRSLKNPKVNDPLINPSDYLGKVDEIGLTNWQKFKILIQNL